jgi:hypothetical protein
VRWDGVEVKVGIGNFWKIRILPAQTAFGEAEDEASKLKVSQHKLLLGWKII